MPPEGVAPTIVVTATSLTTWDGVDSAAQMYDSNISMTYTGWNLFDQFGGGEAIQTIQVELVNLEFIIRIPGYPFIIALPPNGEQWSSKNWADFLKILNEFRDSPELVRVFDRFRDLDVRRVEVYRDDVIHRPDGLTQAWHSSDDSTGKIAIDPGPDGNPEPGSTVTITIRNTVSEGQFPKAVLHEFAHIIFGDDEYLIRNRYEQEMWDDIFKDSDGNLESSTQYGDAKTVFGSHYDDNASGTGGHDTIAGMTGNDNLNGAGGDDLVMGGAGIDTLTGGLGSNAVLGGLDADTYVPTVGVTHEQVEDIGGVDRLDLSSISINDVTVLRGGDDLYIHAPGIASEGIGVTGQWLDASRIEQFTFAEGTFAATYIESFTTPSGVCYDAMGNPMFCSPYGMPVVLDLDGDGIELIALRDSHVRFDVDGDRAPDRVGWVSGDDGILALDRDGNGRIDDFSEISFRADFRGAGSDLEGLYAYDSDRDGFLTAADERFDEFLIWRDLNGNGHSEKRELFTLDALGIVAIDLERRDVKPLDRDADANQIVATTTFRTADGALHLVGDVALFADMSVGGRPAYSPAGEFAALQPEPAFG